MKYLIDTLTYLWFRSGPRMLPARVMDLLTDTTHEIIISMATPWELAIKTGAGRLDAAALLVDFESRETAAGFTIAGVSTAQAIRSGLLPLHHKDPFYRLLAVQALEMNIPLISIDDAFDLYGVTRIWN